MAGSSVLIYITLLAAFASSASIHTPRDGNSQEGTPVTSVSDSSDPVSGISDGAPPTSTTPAKQIIHGMSNSSAVALIVIIGAVVLLVPMFGFIWIRRQKLRRAARVRRMKSRIELAQRNRKGSDGLTDAESPREEPKVTGLGIQKPLPAETAKALPAVNDKEFS